MLQRKEKLWALFQLLGLFPVFVLTIEYQIIACHLKRLYESGLIGGIWVYSSSPSSSIKICTPLL